MSGRPDHGIRVLLVCRANRCRSPFAAAIGRELAADRAVTFSSAGLLPGGERMPRAGLAVAGELGLDLAGHVSAELDLADLDGFDVILTMARDQARDIVADAPGARPRVFTLKQFDRWIAGHPAPDGVALRAWLDDRAADRPGRELIGADPRDDVADPLTEPPAAWRRMADELRGVLSRVVAAIAPAV